MIEHLKPLLGDSLTAAASTLWVHEIDLGGYRRVFKYLKNLNLLRVDERMGQG